MRLHVETNELARKLEEARDSLKRAAEGRSVDHQSLQRALAFHGRPIVVDVDGEHYTIIGHHGANTLPAITPVQVV